MHLHRAAILVALLAVSACSTTNDQVFARVAVGTSPTHGPADAWVTIVEFADFQCPYCSRGAETMRQLQEAYGDDLRLVFKHMPLKMHEHARDAAIAAECAHEQDLFWPMHDQLFANQSALGSADLERYAAAAGLDVATWKTCLSTSGPSDRVDADVALAGQVGVTGTPAYFVNGWLVEGAEPLDDFKKLVDRELEKAKASGISRDRYYEEAVLGAK